MVPAKGALVIDPSRLRRLAHAPMARLLILVLVACVLTTLGAACRSGDDDEPTPMASASATAAAATPAASATPDPLLDPEASGERALEHVRALSVDIGPRVAGTEGERLGVEYIRAELARYGYDVTVEEFAFDASAFLPARVDAQGQAHPGFAFNGSAEGVATGALVFAGIGRPEEFPAGGLNGGIALIERGELTFQQKVENAVAAGAAGAIIYNNEEGSLLAEANTSVQVIGLRPEAGEALRALAAGGAVEATITVSPRRGTAYNVVAKPPGAGACETVSGGHHDSVAVTGGADDNASGTAAVLELARVVAANDRLDANCFVLFGAEEFGLFGSKEYVRQLDDEARDALRAMLNLDVVGLDSDLVLIGSDDVIDTARIAGEEIGIEARRGEVPNGAGSDHASFIEAGIPAVFFYRNDTLIHTPQDSVERIRPESLEETIRIAYATLVALTT
ncbi:MAG: M28 family metallopeptidase [Dehalococcoidia bacterium]